MIHTFNIKIQNWRIDEDGFLRVTARILKEGVFAYSPTEMPAEIAEKFNGKKEILEYIPADEFTAEALKSLEGKPVVVNKHEWRNAENNLTDGLTVGNIAGTPKVVDSCIECDFIITDPDTIEQIKTKKLIEVSAGYESSGEMESGKFGDGEYDLIQRKLRFNHVLLLPEGQGRCGNDIRIYNGKNTGKEITMFELKITNSKGQVEVYHFENEASMREAERMAEAVKIGNEAVVADKDKEIQAKNAEVDQHKTKVTDLQAAITTLEATVATMKADLEKFSSEEFAESAAQERTAYQEDETAVLNSEVEDKDKEETKKELGNCKKMNDRMRLLTTKVMNSKGVDLKDASDDAIKTTFNTLVATSKAKKPENAIPGVRVGNQNGFVHPIHRRQGK